MAFKPLTSSKTSLASATKSDSAEDITKRQPNQAMVTEEKIYIIYDDSSSMSAVVDFNKPDDTRIKLAAEGTTDYMKNCKPHVTEVEIAPLNAEPKTLTKNLPALAAQVKEIDATGGTPLFKALGKLVVRHKIALFTRGLIFTDGEATDDHFIENYRPNLIDEVLEMGIPIDLIIIGAKELYNLSHNERKLKAMAEKTGGTFLICKDASDFKKKMKFFAPLLRHMLPAIASGDARGEF